MIPRLVRESDQGRMKGRKGHNTTVDPQDETINEKDNEKGEERHPHDEFYIDYGGEG